MRLWHKDLLEVLPRQQLVAQWKEIGQIVVGIEKYGKPNHILVNKVSDYSYIHLYSYMHLLKDEFEKRGYKMDPIKFKLREDFCGDFRKHMCLRHETIYIGWHNDLYLRQCLYNLEEKYVCGGISQEEWEKILEKFSIKFDLFNKREVNTL